MKRDRYEKIERGLSHLCGCFHFAYSTTLTQPQILHLSLFTAPRFISHLVIVGKVACLAALKASITMVWVFFKNQGRKGLTATSSPTKTVVWYIILGACHELVHLLTSFCFNLHHGVVNADESYLTFIVRVMVGRAIELPALADADVDASAVVRHSGWIFSVVIALLFMNIRILAKEATNAAIVTAIEAVATDLLQFGSVGVTTLLCGNFGLILINPMWFSEPDYGKSSLQILQKLVEITMMRGAQTGGVVTWAGKPNGGELAGIRSRVVNGKRTDLSEGVVAKVYKDAFTGGKVKSGIRGFFGHTRFATSSKATLDGCHPHQWSPPNAWQVYRSHNLKSFTPTSTSIMVENFITHNGDLDFFRVGSKFHDLHTVQLWLEQATGFPMPATVDSAAIAGLVDLIRTAGSFGLSARFSCLLGLKTSTIELARPLPSRQEYHLVGQVFDRSLLAFCKTKSVSILDISNSVSLRAELAAHTTPFIQSHIKSNPQSSIFVDNFDEEDGTMTTSQFVAATINAFFDNDLFQTTKYFLENARGSFGLMFTSSLDASSQICIAARGQTMSVALYPRKGVICYGSEQAAVKAGLSVKTPGGDAEYLWSTIEGKGKYKHESVRIDLDDLGGEICLIDWSGGSGKDIISHPNRHLEQFPACYGKVRLVFHQQSNYMDQSIASRFILLEGNQFVHPLPPDSDDNILKDIRDIPKICNGIQDSWSASSLNCLTAWNFSRCLRSRLQARVDEKVAIHAGSVDILLTGCEVSLWLAEQFATDLQKAFPKLFVKVVSSNKLLGVFGQELSIPCTGYPLSQDMNDLSDAIILIVSHSGGTFAPLACSNLLQ